MVFEATAEDRGGGGVYVPWEGIGGLDGEVGGVRDITETTSRGAPTVYDHTHENIDEGGGGRGGDTCDDVGSEKWRGRRERGRGKEGGEKRKGGRREEEREEGENGERERREKGKRERGEGKRKGEEGREMEGKGRHR